MTIDPLSDAKIIDSWQKNAEPWTDAVREHQIESRRLITNQAILDAILARAPHTALDIGCGEGWLVRALSSRGIHATGVDVVPALIDRAREAGGGEFRVASYESIAAGELRLRVDAAIANFSLIGKDSVDGLIARISDLLNPRGALIIQTLHPLVATGDLPYMEGWREGSWAGFSADFVDPAPWYFRTIETWTRLIVNSGLRLIELREPLHPKSTKPASLILVAETSG
jgi:2-polyprenyl-3-methyl-5-hydroxy-6-metoxy-1,4-benzoquinol methylase